MSYILDALRRADRERRQGQLADAAAPAFSTASAAPMGEVRSGRWLVGAGALVVALIVAAVLWWWPGAAGPPAARPAPALAQPAPATAAAPSSAAEATLPPPSAPTPPPAAALPRTSGAPMPFLPASAATAVPQRLPALPMATPAPAAHPAPVAAVVAAQDLPPEVRQQLPTLKLSGSIYSPNRSNRLLIVDGQVAHEGDSVAPGVVLEQIQPRSAIFRFRQYRYEVQY